ncbi:MAG: PEP-CTERM sorting domain-containing protein [Acidobacteriota bacterium]|nr:PEP-CTERM sorting domain-containing protein [Acidobacteriota bacterium]
MSRHLIRTWGTGLVVAAAMAIGGTSASGAGVNISAVQTQSLNVDLTALGNQDWIIWGEGSSIDLSGSDSMSGGSGISGLTQVTNGSGMRGLGQFGNYGASSFNWSNGTSSATGAGVWGGIQNQSGYGFDCSTSGVGACGEGFDVSATADGGFQTLTLFGDVHAGTAQITASFSDNSITPQTYDLLDFGSNLPYTMTFAFQGNAGAKLDISVLMTSNYNDDGTGTGNVAIQAAALSQTTAPAPEPASLMLAGLGLLGFAAQRLRRRA